MFYIHYVNKLDGLPFTKRPEERDLDKTTWITRTKNVISIVSLPKNAT